jgi:hypothetical protein
VPTAGMLGVFIDAKKCNTIAPSPYKTGQTGKTGKETAQEGSSEVSDDE